MAQLDAESRPEVGSSRKRRRAGLAASSTPMVKSFRCSTLRPTIQQLVGYESIVTDVITFSWSTHDGFREVLHIPAISTELARLSRGFEMK